MNSEGKPEEIKRVDCQVNSMSDISLHAIAGNGITDDSNEKRNAEEGKHDSVADEDDPNRTDTDQHQNATTLPIPFGPATPSESASCFDCICSCLEVICCIAAFKNVTGSDCCTCSCDHTCDDCNCGDCNDCNCSGDECDCNGCDDINCTVNDCFECVKCCCMLSCMCCCFCFLLES